MKNTQKFSEKKLAMIFRIILMVGALTLSLATLKFVSNLNEANYSILRFWIFMANGAGVIFFIHFILYPLSHKVAKDIMGKEKPKSFANI